MTPHEPRGPGAVYIRLCLFSVLFPCKSVGELFSSHRGSIYALNTHPLPSMNDPTPIAVHKLAVTRTARYATAGAEARHAARCWIVFHGYGQRASDFIAPFAESAPADTRIIAPEGLSRFYAQMPRADGSHLTQTGATWLTRDDRDDELRDALGMLRAVVAQEISAIHAARKQAPQLQVLGFSQGVAMSMRWVVDYAAINRAVIDHVTTSPTSPHRPPPPILRHVLWAGSLAHDVADSALRAAWTGTALDVVVGDRDHFATDAYRTAIADRLMAIGHPATTHQFSGGHRLHTPLLAQLLAEPHRSC